MGLWYVIDVFAIVTPVKLLKNSEQIVYVKSFINLYDLSFLDIYWNLLILLESTWPVFGTFLKFELSYFQNHFSTAGSECF